MKQQWLRIGVLAGALFAINVVGRLVVRFGGVDDIGTQQTLTLLAYGVIAVVMAILAGWWVRMRPTSRVIGELAAAVVAAGVLILGVGPFLSGTTPAAVGAGDTFNAAWQYAGFAAGGTALGLMIITALGKDYTSRSLARDAEITRAKPRRPVRR